MMGKRWRAPKAKDGELKASYGKECGDLDIYYCWPENECGMRADSRLLMRALEGEKIYDEKSLRELLEERGYDITTLKFTIQKKPTDTTPE
jgi:hypothetical protein